MTNIDLERKLTRIERDVLSLGITVEGAVDGSIEALKNRDLALARELVARDVDIDNKRFAIEEECIGMINTTHLGVAKLRLVVAVIGIVTELERIADYAKGIANITLMIGDQPPLKPLVDIPRMAQLGKEMLRGSLESFVERDVEKAKRIWQRDDEVDALYDQVFRELLIFMVEDPRTITRATRLLWAAHNLERFADRVTNICERVVMSVTGRIADIDSPRH